MDGVGLCKYVKFIELNAFAIKPDFQKSDSNLVVLIFPCYLVVAANSKFWGRGREIK